MSCTFSFTSPFTIVLVSKLAHPSVFQGFHRPWEVCNTWQVNWRWCRIHLLFLHDRFPALVTFFAFVARQRWQPVGDHAVNKSFAAIATDAATSYSPPYPLFLFAIYPPFRQFTSSAVRTWTVGFTWHLCTFLPLLGSVLPIILSALYPICY